MKILDEIFTKLGGGWIIDNERQSELLTGYYRLKSSYEKNKNFSMYCCVVGDRLYIKGCVFEELNGLIYSIPLKRGAERIANSIILNVIDHKGYLFKIINQRNEVEN